MQPRTVPAATSLTWCLPSSMRENATLTAHSQTMHVHIILTWKCRTRNMASMNARDAWPLGNEYLSIETVIIMSSVFSAGRWRRTIAFVTAITITSNTSTAHNTEMSSIFTTALYLNFMLSFSAADIRKNNTLYAKHLCNLRLLHQNVCVVLFHSKHSQSFFQLIMFRLGTG